MKRLLLAALAALLILSVLAGCAKPVEDKKIVVGASPAPHAEILEKAKDILAKEGYELVIKEFTDYVQPNLALQSGDLDANYFQHRPYLEDFNEENNTQLVPAGVVHYEPFGIYGGKAKTLGELADGAEVAVPNDTTNEARALLLLEAQGLINVRPDAGLEATVIDIVGNPKNIKIVEVEAAQLPRLLSSVDLAVINGNYALQAGLNAATDSLALEEQDSLAAETFANVVAVKEGSENNPEIKALVDALKSDQMKKYIEDTYKGAVVPVD
ncbi:MAG: ABC transporter substrate-binding protein [Clostridiales bacterium]|nr:ABC transporter substrate-binding protein [Clostridiales bacterium]